MGDAAERGKKDRPTVVDRGSWTYADDRDLVADPWSTWDRLREESRAFVATKAAPDWDVWTLLRYDDVRAALRDPDLFSSRSVLHVYQGPKLIDPAEADTVRGMIPEELDPPEHTKYRQLLTPLFAPQVVETLEPMIRSWCVDLIESFAADGHCDLNGDFARQYPTMIFLRLMGLPKGGVGDFLDTVHDRIREATQLGASQQQSLSAAYIMAMSEYMNSVLDERRVERQDDIVSYLLDVEVDGRPLDGTELQQICTLLYAAGLDTVAGELGFMFLHLAAHPEHRRLVTESPERIPAFVEEALRAYSIVTTNRIVTRDVEFAGCPMKAGDRVLLSIPAADRDPVQFPRADEFDVDRTSNRHIAFAAGPHRCLGSHLARLELKIAVEEWHRRIPEYLLADGADVTFHIGGVAGVDSLPLEWPVA
jgi:cytochrome P450